VRYSALLATATAAIEVGLAGGEDGGATFTYQIRSGDPDVDAVASQFALALPLPGADAPLAAVLRLHAASVIAARCSAGAPAPPADFLAHVNQTCLQQSRPWSS